MINPDPDSVDVYIVNLLPTTFNNTAIVVGVGMIGLSKSEFYM